MSDPTPLPSDRQKPSRHHGDLRASLIRSGMEILNEKGAPALTLRACAARSGVSHAAPAHHFAGLPGLLTAITAEGFRLFTEAMLAEKRRAGDDAYAQLLAICRGYLTFAEANPALFALMFNADFERTDEPSLKEWGPAAYRVLAEACAPFASDAADAPRIEMAVWSLVHGFACLQLSGSVGPPEARAEGVPFDTLLATLVSPE